MEHVSRGNLFQLIKQKRYFQENEAFYYFVQATAGIYFLHEHGFIHRDLKPENLLISEINILKICDFGWCAQLGEDAEEKRQTFCGTLEYMAPEMLQSLPHNHLIDVWSLGILLYEMCHGKAPFRGNQMSINNQIQTMKSIPFREGLSNEYKDLVSKLLLPEPDDRLPLIKVFDHPWVLYFQ